ncbi:hypothetical protein LLG95_14690, partial [bacterium]|nr:hypothetical protein [bacterium]
GHVSADGEVNQVVAKYLGGDLLENRPERVWNEPAAAPGCRSMRLHKVAVYDKDGEPNANIGIEDPFTIGVEYWVTRPWIRCGATAMVWNDDGQLVFMTFSNTDAEWHTKMRPEGLYRSVVHIPANFLNSGRHSVSVQLWKENYDPSTREDEVVHFHVNDTGGVRGDFMGKILGAVRPEFQWETEQLSEEQVVARR